MQSGSGAQRGSLARLKTWLLGLQDLEGCLCDMGTAKVSAARRFD